MPDPIGETAVIDALRRRAHSLANDLITPLLSFLAQAREAFGGDMDKLLILMVIAARATEHPRFAELARETMSRPAPQPLPSLGTNIRSVSESLRIPRETVRRKVRDLISEGLIIQQGRSLHLSSTAFRTLDPLSGAHHILAARHHAIVGEVLSDRDKP